MLMLIHDILRMKTIRKSQKNILQLVFILIEVSSQQNIQKTFIQLSKYGHFVLMRDLFVAISIILHNHSYDWLK